MSQLKVYTPVWDEVVNVGRPTEDIDRILEVGEYIATGRPSLIAFVEGPVLQKWVDADEPSTRKSA